jgi:hypothetical protein
VSAGPSDRTRIAVAAAPAWAEERCPTVSIARYSGGISYARDVAPVSSMIPSAHLNRAVTERMSVSPFAFISNRCALSRTLRCAPALR